MELVEDLGKKGVEFISIQDSIDTTNAMGKAMFKINGRIC
ncbi:recombinase family protein [Peribacillus butanolivorans]